MSRRYESGFSLCMPEFEGTDSSMNRSHSHVGPAEGRGQRQSNYTFRHQIVIVERPQLAEFGKDKETPLNMRSLEGDIHVMCWDGFVMPLRGQNDWT